MEEKITAWIARDEEGGLYIHKLKPNKETDFWIGLGDNMVIDRHLFPQIKWEDDEPTEVELTIKICE